MASPAYVDLPYELWTTIAGFLSKEDVKSLYGLNRVCTSVALDAKYHTLTIGLDPGLFPQLHPRGFPIYHRLKSFPSLANRVKELVFDIHPGACLALGKLKAKPRSKLSAALARKRGKDPDAYDLERFVQTRGQVNLARLTCEYGPKRSSPTLDVIRFCTTHLLPADTLHTLSLELPLYACNILASMSSMPFLRSLHISLQVRAYNHEDDIQTAFRSALKRITTFTTIHSQVLQEWGVAFDSSMYNMAPLLEPLKPMPLLRSFTFYAGLFSDFTPVRRFMALSCTSNLHDLRILLPIRIGTHGRSGLSHQFFTYDFPLPSLKTLSIEFQTVFPQVEELHTNVIQLVRGYAGTVLRFSISQSVLRIDSVEDLVRGAFGSDNDEGVVEDDVEQQPSRGDQGGPSGTSGGGGGVTDSDADTKTLKTTTTTMTTKRPQSVPLQSLSLEVTGLLVELSIFDLLVEELPNLAELNLILLSFPPFDQLLQELRERAEDEYYVDWHIRHISLDYHRVGTAPAFVDRYVQALRTAIPSLVSVEVKL